MGKKSEPAARLAGAWTGSSDVTGLAAGLAAGLDADEPALRQVAPTGPLPGDAPEPEILPPSRTSHAARQAERNLNPLDMVTASAPGTRVRPAADISERQAQIAMLQARLSQMTVTGRNVASPRTPDTMIGNLLRLIKSLVEATGAKPTWKNVASYLGVHPVVIHRWRTGGVEPKINTLMNLITHWNEGVSPDLCIALMLGGNAHWQILIGPDGRHGVVTGHRTIHHKRDLRKQVELEQALEQGQ